MIVDDVFSYVDVIKGIKTIGRSDIFIISSSRTAHVELQEGFIRNLFDNYVEIFNIDSLSETETSRIIEFFDKYALWGVRQPQTFEQKKAFIKRDCSGELRFLILEALNSPNIRTRIQGIINVQGSAFDQDRVRTILVLSQLLNLAQVQGDLSLISEIAGFDARKAIGAHADNLKDFTLIRNGKIAIKSPIFSEYVIKQLIETPFVINIMINSMRQIDVLHDNSP